VQRDARGAPLIRELHTGAYGSSARARERAEREDRDLERGYLADMVREWQAGEQLQRQLVQQMQVQQEQQNTGGGAVGSAAVDAAAATTGTSTGAADGVVAQGLMTEAELAKSELKLALMTTMQAKVASLDEDRWIFDRASAADQPE
jgi:hypothetical protein